MDFFHPSGAVGGRLELPGDLLQGAAGLLRVIADYLEKPLAERVFRLQTDEELNVLQVGIDLQSAQDIAVSRVGLLAEPVAAGTCPAAMTPATDFEEVPLRGRSVSASKA